MIDDKKLTGWIAILEDIERRAEEMRRNGAPIYELRDVSEPRFDFEKLAFERLRNRIGDSKIDIREYNRLCGLLYSLKKSESRMLLASLKKRFPVESNNQNVWIRGGV